MNIPKSKKTKPAKGQKVKEKPTDAVSGQDGQEDLKNSGLPDVDLKKFMGCGG
ncbi:MAG: hypothetical protein RIG77_00075 [Cyclobacteriaceae bacterium]